MFIVEWWSSLSAISQVFCCVAVPATVVLIVQTVMMFIGIGDDADGFGDGGVDDVGGEVPDSIPELDSNSGIFGENSIEDVHDLAGLEGLRVFTVRGIVAFCVVFGWLGIAMDSAGVKLWITLPVAFVCGFAMMMLLAVLFRAVMRLRSDGNTDNRNAVGTSGKVHLTIPPSRTGEGKVHVMLQGSYVERNAVTDETEAIPTGSEVVVVGVSGQTDLVVKRK